MVVRVVMGINAVVSASVWEATRGLRNRAKGKLHILQHESANFNKSSADCFMD